MAAFFGPLKVFGLVRGQKLNVVAGGFDLHDDQFAGVAATLAKAAHDTVFCVSDAATRVMELAHPVPIVALSTDLVAAGLVRSLARPGGGDTGVSILGSELDGKRLEIVHAGRAQCAADRGPGGPKSNATGGAEGAR